MKIEINKVVSLAYELQSENESGKKSFVENVGSDQPMVFLFGASGFPEKFEEELVGLEEGAAFDFMLDSDEAFGDLDEEAVVRLPIDVFKIDGKFDASKFKVGTFVPMSDAEGHRMQGKVLDVSEIDLQIDFNHPLAGLNLHFKGKVLEVRDATKEEIDHGHVHGHGGHHH